MNWRCGVLLCSINVAVCLFAPFRCPAQPAPAAQQATQPASLDGILKFDADDKTVTVTNGTTDAHFKFTVTNIASEYIIISSIVGSCHCTVAQMPSIPWKLAPKEGGEFSA